MAEPKNTSAATAASTSASDTLSVAAIEEAKARAESNDPDALEADDLDDDLAAPTNIGAPDGKPIPCIVRQKFYSDEGRVEQPGSTYYLQLRVGQTFPSKVLEPIDAKLAAKFRAQYKDRQAERREREVRRNEMRDALLVNRV